MNEMDNIVTLIDEEGKEMNFEILDVISYQDEDYAIMVTCDDVDEEADTVIIVRIDVDENGEEFYSSVEDEAILDAVFETFKENSGDDFDFVD